MRRSFIEALTELAIIDDRIVLLTADLGFMALEPFADRFPDRFFNVGVAEQNMIAMATGLAEAGLIPFVYSIAPFSVLRPLEFIRNGPIYHFLPVRIVGVGGGLEYSTNGISHYGLEDIGVLRVIPGITIIAPADHRQAREALRATWNRRETIYYRLGKDDVHTLPGLEGSFDFEKPQLLMNGPDLLFVAIGNVALEVFKAIKLLEDEGILSTLLVISTIGPSVAEAMESILKGFRAVISVEAHFINGGLGSLIAEIIAEYGLSSRLVRCGVRSITGGLTGSQDYMYRINGLTGELIAQTARQVLAKQ
jgi:transketolase